MNKSMLKLEHVSKEYRLGLIGGTTLREELQRWAARMRHREDPTRKIGSPEYQIGETFMALEDVSFEVMKGERVGIIGHNGAGKSTLLKLISRITAPKSGDIWLNGRVASMLEVGTGFHGELTGRENIYMNGAILGMKRREIDAKIEDIIEFSECRQFIDTPVKRYSSGMYVKLAFSVAAHLDSEIMIMDEVLAVGDMAFQKKCLDKMSDVSKTEGRTILYVSHNMNTIRQLCDRCIVLNHGKVVFDGDVEKAIEKYLESVRPMRIQNDFTDLRRNRQDIDQSVKFVMATFLDKTELPIYKKGERIRISVHYTALVERNDMAIRWTIHSADGLRAGMSTTGPKIKSKLGENDIVLELPLDWLAPGKYIVDMVAYSVNEYGHDQLHDVIEEAFIFEKDQSLQENNGMKWHHSWWGYVMFPEMQVQSENGQK